MRHLSQIGADPRPGDKIERAGRVFEVIGVTDDGFVLYRVERVRLKKPSLMTRSSWKTLALDTLTEPYTDTPVTP